MKKNIPIIILLIAALLLGVYFIGILYYKNRFPMNVYVNEINIGGMTLKKANNKLEKADVFHKIIIQSDTEEFLEIQAEQIDYKYVETQDLPEIFNQQNKWKWFLAIFNDSEYTAPITSIYDKDKVKNLIDRIHEFDKELLNANLVYSDRTDSFIIEPHSYEFQINKEELFDLVIQSIDKRESELNIEKHILQPSIFEDDIQMILAKGKANEYLDVQLNYDFGDRREFIDRSLLKDWITTQGVEVDFDREKVKEYVVSIARKYDTYGRGRKFKTTSGKTITTSGGTYGWVIHRGKTVEALIDNIKDGENKTIEPVYSYKALIRNSDDLGNSYVEIDLENQMVYVYINGALRIATETVTGNIAKGNNTARGVFPLNYKETDAVLVGEDYASPVKYWMPFNGHIGLHDADWRTSFGGDIYETNGSNGCVNLPPEKTRTIFDLVYPGMPVIVH